MNWTLYNKCTDVIWSINNTNQVKAGYKYIDLALKACHQDHDVMTAHHICGIRSCSMGPIFKPIKPEWVKLGELRYG